MEFLPCPPQQQSRLSSFYYFVHIYWHLATSSNIFHFFFFFCFTIHIRGSPWVGLTRLNLMMAKAIARTLMRGTSPFPHFHFVMFLITSSPSPHRRRPLSTPD